MRIFLPFAFVSLVVTSALAQPQGRETVKVGPWTIATTYKGDKFDNCTMTNSAEGTVNTLPLAAVSDPRSAMPRPRNT